MNELEPATKAASLRLYHQRNSRSTMFAIKTGISDPQAETFTFTAQKTMYGGKHISALLCPGLRP